MYSSNNKPPELSDYQWERVQKEKATLPAGYRWGDMRNPNDCENLQAQKARHLDSNKGWVDTVYSKNWDNPFSVVIFPISPQSPKKANKVSLAKENAQLKATIAALEAGKQSLIETNKQLLAKMEKARAALN